MSEKTSHEPDWEALAKHWPSSFISRNKVQEFTGGLISSRTLANLDSLNEGPPSFRWKNKKIFYEVDPFVKWMRKRFLAGRIQPQKSKSK